MILRRTLIASGWCAIVLAPLFAIWGLWSTLNFSRISGQSVEFGMVASALAGVIPAIIVGVGFGSALLMLASIDRRLGILEGKE